jgi:hypothetical protein
VCEVRGMNVQVPLDTVVGLGLSRYLLGNHRYLHVTISETVTDGRPILAVFLAVHCMVWEPSLLPSI